VQRSGRGQFSGRWTTTASGATDTDRERTIEIQAWAFLRRYGVVFRRLLTREPNAVPWRELTRTYRRLEARGEIRGGRFVAGMSGEQFALPDAVDRLREVRRTALDGRLHSVSTADPLNLVGVLTAGERIRAAARNTLVYRDGLPIAVVENEVVRELVPLDSATLVAISRSSRRGTPVLTR
jgi:ATP-dependent Lhr-like helicase